MAQLCHEIKPRHSSSSLQAMEVTAGQASNNRASQSLKTQHLRGNFLKNPTYNKTSDEKLQNLQCKKSKNQNYLIQNVISLKVPFQIWICNPQNCNQQCQHHITARDLYNFKFSIVVSSNINLFLHF